MKIRSAVLGVIALTAAVSIALPARAADAPPAPPTPSPEMGQLTYLVGTWSCKGTVETTPFGPGHATQAAVHIRHELGGFWNIGRYEEKKTAGNPHPMSFEFIYGYDPAAKALTLDGYDVVGNRSHQTASAWQDGKLVFNGQNMGADGHAIPARDTFTKKSETVMEHLGEMQIEGNWVRIDGETCTRSKK
jgi:hypothetical protein